MLSESISQAALGELDASRAVIERLEDDSRRMLQALLELDGHCVMPAEDGESGLQLILSQRPDVALVDIGLPGMDGYDVARAVRESPEACCTYLVALTGYGQPSDVERALQAGFNQQLTKPVAPETLIQLLNSLPQVGRGKALV